MLRTILAAILFLPAAHAVDVTVYNEPGPLPHRYSGGIWGIDHTLPHVQDHIYALEVGSVHVGLYWTIMQRSTGMGDLLARLANFPYDAFLAGWQGDVLVGLDGVPPWLAQPGLDPQGSPPTDMETWEEIVEVVVDHFGPGAYYQIWNEPDGTWQSDWASYAETYLTAQAVIRAGGAQDVGPELNNCAYQLRNGEYWMEKAIAEFAPNVASCHAYTQGAVVIGQHIDAIRVWGHAGPIGITEFNLFALGDQEVTANEVGAAWMAHAWLSGLDLRFLTFQGIMEPDPEVYMGAFAEWGVSRPVWQAFRLLNAVKGTGYRADCPEVALACAAGSAGGWLRIGVSLFDLTTDPRPLEITLSGFGPASQAIVFLVDEAHVPTVAQTNSDNAGLWLYALLGMYEQRLEELNDARDAMVNAYESVVVTGGNTVTFEVSPRSVALLMVR